LHLWDAENPFRIKGIVDESFTITLGRETEIVLLSMEDMGGHTGPKTRIPLARRQLMS